MTPFNSEETVPTGAAVTVLEGSTFCLSDAAGDVVPGAGLGLFLRDTRILSRWELRLDGQPAEILSVRQPEAFVARFVLRRAPDLLLVRERLVGDGMRETITIDNLGRTTATVELTLHFDADFADLFSVKEGRPVPGPERDVSVSSSAPNDAFGALSAPKASFGAFGAGELSWRVVVPGRSRWATEVVVVDRGVPFTGTGRRSGAHTAITAGDPVLADVLRRTESDLDALRIEDPHPFVAAGAPWYMTLFGRDSLLTAWMALPLDPTLALGTLRALAESQGTRVDPATEEEPGRIMHELRRGTGSAAALGGSHYYGTADATPLFVMLLAECRRWGADEDAVRALLPAADAALSWVDRHDEFVTYERATDRGLVNQGWKDSADAINDAAGQPATTPIALCEVQGYVYAALLARAELGDTDPAPLLARAERLRERFAEAFWLPDRGWYAVALDGSRRPVDALTSNAAHCLWTGIATDEHAAVLIERLAEPDMDSGYGLRTLASSMGAYHPMSYHNGSVWPHDTAIAVAGLLRYAHLPGAVSLAHRLAGGLLDAAAAFGGRLPELYCGFGRDEFDPPVPYPTSCSPQAWASAAPLLLVRSLLGLAPDVPRRTVTVDPRLPARWEVTLSELRLGPATVTVAARGDSAEVTGLPADWTRER